MASSRHENQMKAVAREQQCYHNEADVQGNNSSTIEYNKITV